MRDDILVGSTYKIKSPLAKHAIYVTINDTLLPNGTAVPFEMFINSKNIEHHQWMSAITLIISALFRKGGNLTFLVDELKNVFDPKGGYFKKGGIYMNSDIAEIGYVLETHFKKLGVLKSDELSAEQTAFIADKRKEAGVEEVGYPDNAAVCQDCGVKAVISLDKCPTCLSCGASKCG